MRQRVTWITRRALKFADIRSVLKRRRFGGLRDEFYDRLWRDAARELGAECHDLAGLKRISLDGLATFVSHSDLMLDDLVTTRVMAHKAVTYQLLSEKGLPVPEHCVFSLDQLGRARDFLARTPGPIVVKPATGTGGGHGVTTGIRTERSLLRAALHAASFNAELLAEPMLAGNCYRLLYLDGRLLDAVRRDPPTVCGDGRSSIRALVAAQNRKRLSERPISALSPLVIDQDALHHLAAQGLDPGQTPADGERIVVKRAVNENADRENHTVTAEVHPGIVSAGAGLVTDLGVRFAGLDVIADDISAPLGASGAQFHEVNVGPGIHHHYLVADRSGATPVATRILQYLFENRQGVMRL
ncbi:hypothetical protein [Actibacterium sp. MT2.3-13A]|uniref:hypothetical protein n=1 Tax=Actibacterium sp. MT2.3-13A TaxID=2828332 RepID=UPI001BAB647F|nr:hypothetical protein [Actibacterium sp. MT2.3-13A]